MDTIRSLTLFEAFDPKLYLANEKPGPCAAWIIPGGFSFGDYLRAGALASQSLVGKQIISDAKAGKPVLGICNGFQILAELGLVPGTLRRNAENRFISREVELIISDTTTPFTTLFKKNEKILLPLACGFGNYFNTGRFEAVVGFENGVTGALRQTAGVRNTAGNVLGMMPHPERRTRDVFKNQVGRKFFMSLLKTLRG